MQLQQDIKSMIKKIKNLLTNKKIKILSENQRVSDTHLIAIARLMFIKPADLVREAKNNKANGEYLLKMIEARNNEK